MKLWVGCNCFTELQELGEYVYGYQFRGVNQIDNYFNCIFGSILCVFEPFELEDCS